MLRETQLQSYEELKDHLPDRRRAVLSVLEQHGELPLFSIVEILGWGINCISGRLTELAGLGMIQDSGKRLVNPSSGKRAIVWKPTGIKFEGNGQRVFF